MAIKLEARPPLDAIGALKARSGALVPTFSHLDLFGEEHASAVTVAKSAGFDILNDVLGGLLNALETGQTGRDFAKELTPLLQAKGWWGRQSVADPLTGETVDAQLGSTRRLQTIYETNMRVSYAAGHWAQFERTKGTRPWLRYVAVMDGRTRPEHAARHNLCLRVDDPYWDVWAPPCGYGCRCTLQSLSDADVARMRGQLKFTPPPDRYRTWENSRTGEVQRLPLGIDPGWGYNPGKVGHQAVLAADKLASADPAMAAAAVADPTWPAAKLADEFEGWFDAAAAGQPTPRNIWPVGALNQATLDALQSREATPASGAIGVQASVVRHMIRAVKQARGVSVPQSLLRRLPELIRRPKAVLLDKRDQGILYVFDVPGDARLGKLVVRIDFATKVIGEDGIRRSTAINAVRTAGLVAKADLADINAYEVLSGSLE